MDPTARGGAAVPDRPGAVEPVDFTKHADREQPHPQGPAADVGDFRQGTASSQWALSRYLVGRSMIEAIGRSMLLIAALFFVIAIACQWWLHQTAVAVLAAVFGLVVLLVRAASLGVLRRLTAVGRFGPAEDRMGALVKDTRGDVLRELRRLGLPGRTLTLPWLAVRLLGRRRKDTLLRLRGFDIDRVVPPARVDELHLLWNSAGDGGAVGPGGAAPR